MCLLLVRCRYRVSFPANCSAEFISLIQGMLCKDPTARFTLDQIRVRQRCRCTSLCELYSTDTVPCCDAEPCLFSELIYTKLMGECGSCEHNRRRCKECCYPNDEITHSCTSIALSCLQPAAQQTRVSNSLPTMLFFHVNVVVCLSSHLLPC